MPSDLYKIEKQDDVSIMCLTLDAFSYDDNDVLMEPFETFLKEGNKKIILDLVNTKYVSSLILASLVYMQKRAQDGGGDLIICNVKERVQEVLRMTNLDKIFKIVGTREDALGKFGKKQ